MVVPARPFGIRHLTDDELPRRDLVAEVLEPALACVFVSFAGCFRHQLSIVRDQDFL